MRIPTRTQRTEVGFNMTPMIDVVFLLIIFFMTVTQVSEINKEQLELPQQEGSTDQLNSNVTINVDREGQVIISGNRVTVPEMVGLMIEPPTSMRPRATQMILKLVEEPSRK